MFDLWPSFHKVFATCCGHHVEIDTRADQKHDATGLGRIHREGVWPETALSGSISSSIIYNSRVIPKAAKGLALGPAWKEDAGEERRLADFEHEIENVVLTVITATQERVAFTVRYYGDFHECRGTVEAYEPSGSGLAYSVETDNPSLDVYLTVPLIQTDGIAHAAISVQDGGFRVRYRGTCYTVVPPEGASATLTGEEAANRNAICRVGIIHVKKVHVAFATIPPSAAT